MGANGRLPGNTHMAGTVQRPHFERSPDLESPI
jgi:hypothetical protein